MTEKINQKILFEIFKNQQIVKEITKAATVLKVKKGVEIVKYNSLNNGVLIIAEGSVNIYIKDTINEILLYSLKEKSLCVHSFEMSMQQKPSAFRAISNEECSLLIIPNDCIETLISEHTNFMLLVFSEYAKCQTFLLDSFKALAFTNLECRLKGYLESDANRQKTHQEIANDLGTAREVVSRLIKKVYANN